MVSGLAGAGLTFFVWAVLATLAAVVCAIVAAVSWIEARSSRAYAVAQQERLDQHRADLEVQRVAHAKAADDQVRQMRVDTDAELASAREDVANANREARARAEEALRQRSRTLDERGWAVAAEERQAAERLRQVRDEVQALEDLQNATLHRTFAERRVNRVNLKREFFRVSLAEIEAVAQRHHPAVEFMHIAHAHEWRQSEAIRAGAPLPMIATVEDLADPLDGLD